VQQETPLPSIRNEILIVLLALASVLLLVLEVVSDLKPHQRWLVERVDLAIAVIFLVEWLWRLKNAERKSAFLRSSWWELLAAIPITSDVTRALRGLRLLRILRIVRLAVRFNILLGHLRKFGESTRLLAITTTVISIVVCGALGFHYFEFGLNPNVHTFWDSIWWSFMTITTVGYGDIYPHTTGGRIVAILLMVLGLGTFGVYAGVVGAWIVERHREDA
jgi:voltage-gated potassium channel